ncbi:hypothetical protein ACIQH6_19150 [Micromonospora orduensis]|uniref:hypothetical protein n=1 Tax=Micromonospora orduensis TaxID=1420891 RepID=UPI0038066EE6
MTSTRPLAHPASSPTVAIDLDGVLNPANPAHAETLGYRPHRYDGPAPDGRHVTGHVWLHPDHGPCCGNWPSTPNLCGAPAGTGWPPHGSRTARLTDHLTARPRPRRRGPLRPPEQTQPLYAWAARRLLAVLDNEFGGEGPTIADQRTADGVPPCSTGSTRTGRTAPCDVDTMLTWLSQL